MAKIFIKLQEETEALPHFKLLTALSIVTVLDIGLLSFACYLVYKIYKLLKFTDIPILLSIISITLALLFLLAFCIMDITSFNVSNDNFLNTVMGVNTSEQVDRLKVMFIYCAFVFDLYKWCIFIAATGTQIS